MHKHPLQATDERGYFTLPLPKAGPLDVLYHYRWYRLASHYALYLRLRFRWLSQHFWMVVGIGFGLATIVMIILFLMPRSLSFSFAGDSCTFTPQLLPNLSQEHTSPGYRVSEPAGMSIGNYPLFSSQLCIHATQAPTAGNAASVGVSPFGLPFIKKQVKIHTPALPTASPAFDASQAVGSSAVLSFALDQHDTTFTYALTQDQTRALCERLNQTLLCDLKPLALKPGSSYQLSLLRLFDDAPSETILTTGITTLDPVIVTSSSITPGAVVFDSPERISLQLNKAIEATSDITLTNETNGTKVDVQVTHEDANLGVSFAALARESTYVLRVGDLTATDESQLLEPYELRFTTSGGPKVQSVSIGTYKVSPSASVEVRFDVGLLPSQDLAKYIRLETTAPVTTRLSLNGTSVSINPVSDLPRCTNFRVIIDPGLTSQYGIGGGQAWSYSSRTICQTTFSIGTSVRGRSITAYRFGSGSSKVLFVGGTHGNEKSSTHTLNGLIDYLELHAGEIPGHRSVIVIPNLNPDGYASGSRTNANTVDLNRNFPSNDWQTSIQMPGGINLPNGGGMTPLDQPEAQALASYVQANNPRLVLTYHAVARVVISNDVGDSVAQAGVYAQKSGYKFTSNADSHGTFEYATTGEFEDWLADKENIPGILVELGTMSSNEFNTHRSAMWSMITLP